MCQMPWTAYKSILSHSHRFNQTILQRKVMDRWRFVGQHNSLMAYGWALCSMSQMAKITAVLKAWSISIANPIMVFLWELPKYPFNAEFGFVYIFKGSFLKIHVKAVEFEKKQRCLCWQLEMLNGFLEFQRDIFLAIFIVINYYCNMTL